MTQYLPVSHLWIGKVCWTDASCGDKAWMTPVEVTGVNEDGRVEIAMPDCTFVIRDHKLLYDKVVGPTWFWKTASRMNKMIDAAELIGDKDE